MAVAPGVTVAGAGGCVAVGGATVSVGAGGAAVSVGAGGTAVSVGAGGTAVSVGGAAGTVLVVRGEIDLSVATRFAQELEGVAVVDMEHVVFIDSAGVRELVRAQHRALERGGDLVLRSPSDACQRVLQLSGLWGEFTVADAV